jgi:hypothetical protein
VLIKGDRYSIRKKREKKKSEEARKIRRVSTVQSRKQNRV